MYGDTKPYQTKPSHFLPFLHSVFDYFQKPNIFGIHYSVFKHFSKPKIFGIWYLVWFDYLWQHWRTGTWVKNYQTDSGRDPKSGTYITFRNFVSLKLCNLPEGLSVPLLICLALLDPYAVLLCPLPNSYTKLHKCGFHKYSGLSGAFADGTIC